MTFRETLDSGKFVVTAEVGPPKGTDIHDMLRHIELLKGKVDAANVTDNQSAVMRICSLAVCKIALEQGLEPILQMTCRDRNRIGLQSDLLGAHILGIRNVLCMTGDHVAVGDHKAAKPVYDIESVQLLRVVDSLNRGKDMAGNDLKGPTDFYQGAVVTPRDGFPRTAAYKVREKGEGRSKVFPDAGDIRHREIQRVCKVYARVSGEDTGGYCGSEIRGHGEFYE